MKKSFVMVSMFLGLSVAALSLPMTAHAEFTRSTGDPTGGGDVPWYHDDNFDVFYGVAPCTDSCVGSAPPNCQQYTVGSTAIGISCDSGHGCYLWSNGPYVQCMSW
jgi:hypothetical protein